MSYKRAIILTMCMLLQFMFSYQQNLVLKWVSDENLPKSGNYLIMEKTLNDTEDPGLCEWFKGTDNRLLGESDFDSKGSFIKGTNLEPRQCSLSIKSYDKDTHDELDYYKPFKTEVADTTYDSLPKEFTQNSNFKASPPDLVYALAYFNKNEFRLDEEETGKPNERKFKCHAKVFVKAHEFGQEFTEKITEQLQDRLHFEIEAKLRVSKTKLISSSYQFSKNSTFKFIKWFKNPRPSRSTNKLIDYQMGDIKTVYLSDIQVMERICCNIKAQNEDNSIFFEEQSCINGENLHKFNLFLLLSTLVINIFIQKN